MRTGLEPLYPVEVADDAAVLDRLIAHVRFDSCRLQS
jgi:hypothetical protein